MTDELIIKRVVFNTCRRNYMPDDMATTYAERAMKAYAANPELYHKLYNSTDTFDVGVAMGHAALIVCGFRIV